MVCSGDWRKSAAQINWIEDDSRDEGDQGEVMEHSASYAIVMDTRRSDADPAPIWCVRRRPEPGMGKVVRVGAHRSVSRSASFARKIDGLMRPAQTADTLTEISS
jgi:hypothetical protein